LDTSVPFIPGDVANATTYPFPVRFRKVEGFTVARAIGKDPTIYGALKTAAQELVDQGVRAVTGDCGFMAFTSNAWPVILSPGVFVQPAADSVHALHLGEGSKVGVLTADGRSLDETLLAAVGVTDADRLVVEGLEEQPHFHRFAIQETGTLDTEKVAAEVVEAGRHLYGTGRNDQGPVAGVQFAAALCRSAAGSRSGAGVRLYHHDQLRFFGSGQTALRGLHIK
jgi:hypothetical protein